MIRSDVNHVNVVDGEEDGEDDTCLYQIQNRKL